MTNIFRRTSSISSDSINYALPKTDTTSSDATLVANSSYGAHSDSNDSYSLSASSSTSSSVHSYSYSRTARLFQYANYEKKTRQKEVQLGHSLIQVIHRPVHTDDGQLLGWNIYRPPSVHFSPTASSCSSSSFSSTSSSASSCSIFIDEQERKIFFVPAIEEVSKVNMKAIKKVDDASNFLFRGNNRRLRLFCRKRWIAPESYVLEARAWE